MGSPTPSPSPGIGSGHYDPHAAADGATVPSGSVDIYGLGDADFLKQEITLRAASARGAQFILSGHSAAQQRDFAEANDIPTGSETLPVKGTVRDQLEAFIRMSSDPGMQKDYLGWQRLLFGAGFYGSAKPTQIAWGTWDVPTKSALTDALKQMVGVTAAGAAVTFQEYLEQLAKRRAELGIGTDQPTRQVRSYSDPAAVRQSAQQAAEQAIGRRLNTAELKRFSEYFHGLENQAYDDAAVQGQYSSPDLGAQAQEFAHGVSPTEYGAHQLGDYVSAFEQLIGG
jgi:hypothetical protein